MSKRASAEWLVRFAGGNGTAANGKTCTSISARASNVPETCNNSGSADDGMWFSFGVPQAGSPVPITVVGGGAFGPAIGMYRGSCGSSTPETCREATGDGSTVQYLFTPGIGDANGSAGGSAARRASEPYLLQGYDRQFGANTGGTFIVNVDVATALPVELSSSAS